MSDEHNIVKGDLVDVYFTNPNLGLSQVKVTYSPSDPGDVWIFFDEDSGHVSVVREYAIIRKIPPRY